MPVVNVSEADFEACFNGAHAARDDGDADTAEALDKLARKINASLSHHRLGPTKLSRKLGWEDMPSVF